MKPQSEEWWAARGQVGRCSAHLTDGSGARCRRFALPGGVICRKHGVNKSVEAAAARRVAERTALQYARDELAKRGTPELDPLEHLEQTLEQAARLFWLADLRCEWEVERGGSLTTKGHDGLEIEAPAAVDRARALQQWARTSKMALDAGVAERKVQIRMQQGEMMLRCAQAAFRLLQAEGVAQVVVQRAQQVFGEEIRRLGPGTP